MTPPTSSAVTQAARTYDPRGSLSQFYLQRLLRTPRGRAFVLSFMVYSEEADEQGVFDALLDRVDDPELRKLVRVHRDDEVRHAGLLRERLAQLGAEPEPCPQELRLIEHIDRHCGGCAISFVAGQVGVMHAYLLLQVIEERAVRQFPRIANAMRPMDPQSAAVIDRIALDEQRHVKYAKAISRRYAPDAETLERSLARLRKAEARAFAEHSQAFLCFSVEHNLSEAGVAEQLLWRALVALLACTAQAAA